MSSLEQRLAENTEALKENNELIRAMLSAAAATTAKRATKKTASDDGKAPAAAEKAAAKAPTTRKKTKFSETDVKEIAAKYLDVEDETEHAERKEKAKKVPAKYGVKKLAEIPEADRAEAIQIFEMLIAGEDYDFDGAEEDDEI
jgi:hypothetical protein